MVARRAVKGQGLRPGLHGPRAASRTDVALGERRAAHVRTPARKADVVAAAHPMLAHATVDQTLTRPAVVEVDVLVVPWAGSAAHHRRVVPREVLRVLH